MSTDSCLLFSERLSVNSLSFLFIYLFFLCGRRPGKNNPEVVSWFRVATRLNLLFSGRKLQYHANSSSLQSSFGATHEFPIGPSSSRPSSGLPRCLDRCGSAEPEVHKFIFNQTNVVFDPRPHHILGTPCSTVIRIGSGPEYVLLDTQLPNQTCVQSHCLIHSNRKGIEACHRLLTSTFMASSQWA